MFQKQQIQIQKMLSPIIQINARLYAVCEDVHCGRTSNTFNLLIAFKTIRK